MKHLVLLSTYSAERTSTMESFDIELRQKYDYASQSSKISLPTYLGDYSVDGNRKFFPDQRNLSYVTIDWNDSKQVEFDLNIGMEKVIRKHPDTSKNEKLSNLMRWLLLNCHKIKDYTPHHSTMTRLSVDFICFRGLLTTLLCTPYEAKDGWIICASKFRGTIYMFAYETPEKRAERESMTERQRIMCSWGFKFEQYMSEGSDVRTPVNENDEYMCVVSTTIGGFKILYSPEIDAVDSKIYRPDRKNLSSCVEFKTSKEPTCDRDHANLHKFKFLKWWSQSYLAGIPRLICGFRDNEGVVRRLKTYTVESFPLRAQEFWKSRIMLNFLKEFLGYVKRIVAVDNPKHVYKFTKASYGDKITCKHYTELTEWELIPDWYINKL